MGAFDQLKTGISANAVWQRAILAGRVSHAWLFTGQSAADLLSLAQAFAAALQCTDRPEGTAEACMHCKSCLQASDGNHPDILVWPHEKPKVFSIDEVRAMVSDVCIRPFSSQYKVYIVPDAHLMRPDAQNALLKTLEEPPAYAVILLLAQSADAMLETVRSRCQTVELSGSRAEYDPLLYQRRGDPAGSPPPGICPRSALPSRNSSLIKHSRTVFWLCLPHGTEMFSTTSPRRMRTACSFRSTSRRSAKPLWLCPSNRSSTCWTASGMPPGG